MRRIAVVVLVLALLLQPPPAHAVRNSNWVLPAVPLVLTYQIAGLGRARVLDTLPVAELAIASSSFLLVYQIAALQYALGSLILAGGTDRFIRLSSRDDAAFLVLFSTFLAAYLASQSAEKASPAAAPPLDPATLQLSSANLGGSVRAIKNFTKLKGKIAVAFAGTIASGADAGRTVKGKLRLRLAGDRS